MGLDWMNRLGIALNTTTEDVKIHNIKLDETQKKILKLKNDFKDLFYINTEIKNLSVKINLKEDAKITQQKSRPVPIHLEEKVANDIKRLIKNGYLERATDNRRLLCEPRGNYSEEGQIGKDRLILKKNERSNNKKKRPNAKYGRTDIENITKNI